MIEEELYQEINTIFKHLTEEEPSPDDEIKARDELIEKFNILKNQALESDQNTLIEDILDKLKKWDTLDLWFKEVDGLSENIRKFINGLNKEDVNEVVSEVEQPADPINETIPEPEKTAVNISEIVAQVSEQFKGEIEGLKSTIESLKKELTLKEKEDDKTPQEKVIPLSSPLKSKLTAPKIRIPVINKSKKAPTIKIQSENEEKKILTINAENDLRKEMADNIASINMARLAQQRTTEDLKQMLEPTDQTKSVSLPIDAQEISPIVSEEMAHEADSEISFELPQESSSKELTNENGVTLTPLPSDKPSIIRVKNDSVLTPLPSEKPSILENDLEVPENLKEIPEIPEMIERPEVRAKSEEIEEPNGIEEVPTASTLTPFPNDELEDITDDIEEVEEVQQTSEIISSEQNPIFGGKPRITPISVEEIDTTSIDTSGADLFNVFSSVGSKTTDMGAKHSEPREMHQPEKIKNKKVDDKKNPMEQFLPPQPTISQAVKSPPPTKLDISPESKIKEKPQSTKIKDDPLPNDKNSLYQELIALEGRRYSLEKSYKDVSLQYGNGKINDYEFNIQSESLRENLDQITLRIKKIRYIISTMQNIQD